jgi:hypothetical protein
MGGFTRSSILQMVASRSSRQVLWQEGSTRKRKWITRRNLLQLLSMFIFELLFMCFSYEVEDISDGCEDNFPQ